MRGLTYQAKADVAVEDVPDPGVEQPGDAIVRVHLAGICGSDLHIYSEGESLVFLPGTRIGHEFIGTVEEVGAEVRGLAPGDAVMSSVSVACGACTWCREGLESSCERWSLFGWAPRTWRHGGDVQGGQSDFVRVPLADTTLVRLPESIDLDAAGPSLLTLPDMMSTGWHGLTFAGVGPGQSVVVIGDGAVGQASVHGARAKGAEVVVCLGHHSDRLATASALGATSTVDSRETEEIKEAVMAATGGEGVNAVIDTISGPESMAAAHACVRPGGWIACLGMDHFMGRFTGRTPVVNWVDQFLRNIQITGGLVPGRRYLPELLGLLEAGTIAPAPIISHVLPLEQGPEAYRKMAEREEGVRKIALRPGA